MNKKRQEEFKAMINKPIEIRLKPNIGDIDKILSEDTMKIIKHEYATKYLESINVDPTIENINHLLKRKPFTKCRIEPEGVAGKPGLTQKAKRTP